MLYAQTKVTDLGWMGQHSQVHIFLYCRLTLKWTLTRWRAGCTLANYSPVKGHQDPAVVVGRQPPLNKLQIGTLMTAKIWANVTAVKSAPYRRQSALTDVMISAAKIPARENKKLSRKRRGCLAKTAQGQASLQYDGLKGSTGFLSKCQLFKWFLLMSFFLLLFF